MRRTVLPALAAPARPFGAELLAGLHLGKPIEVTAVQRTIPSTHRVLAGAASDGEDAFAIWLAARGGDRLDLMGSRIATDGAPADPDGRLLVAGVGAETFRESQRFFGSATDLANAAIAFNGEEYVLVFSRSVGDDPETRRLYTTTMTRDGIVHDTVGTLVAIHAHAPRLVRCGARFLLVAQPPLVVPLDRRGIPLRAPIPVGDGRVIDVEGDGNGALLITSENEHTALRRIAADGSIAWTRHVLGDTRNARAAWNGTEYLLAWDGAPPDRPFLTARIALDGTISAPARRTSRALNGVELLHDEDTYLLLRLGDFRNAAFDRGGDLFAQRLDANGAPIGLPVRLSDHWFANECVAAARTGRGVFVGWSHRRAEMHFAMEVRGAVLARGSPPPVNGRPLTQGAAGQRAVVAAASRDGFALLWSEWTMDASDETLLFRRFRRDGTPVDARPIAVGTCALSWASPTIASDGGTYLISWTNSWRHRERIEDRSTRLVLFGPGGPAMVSRSIAETHFHVAAVPGTYIAASVAGGEIRAVRYSAQTLDVTGADFYAPGEHPNNIAIVNAGERLLVLWGAGGDTRAQFSDSPEPFTVRRGADEPHRPATNGTDVIVQNGFFELDCIAPDGTVSPIETPPQIRREDRGVIAWVGGQWLIAGSSNARRGGIFYTPTAPPVSIPDIEPEAIVTPPGGPSWLVFSAVKREPPCNGAPRLFLAALY